jgi:hypothetical protein
VTVDGVQVADVALMPDHGKYATDLNWQECDGASEDLMKWPLLFSEVTVSGKISASDALE